MEEKISKLMKSLDITREQAIELIEDDKRIDKGEKLFELSDEQKKNVKKATNVGTKKPTVYKFDTDKSKNRKKDDEKGEIVTKIAEFLATFVQNAQILNAEREISFEIGENSYSLTLTKHRKAKK